MPPWFPRKLGLALARKKIKRAIGRMEDYGLPKPDHEPLEAHPSVSGLMEKLARRETDPSVNALLDPQSCADYAAGGASSSPPPVRKRDCAGSSERYALIHPSRTTGQR